MTVQHLRSSFHLMGCKPRHSIRIADRVLQTVQAMSKGDQAEIDIPQNQEENQVAINCVDVSSFFSCVEQALRECDYRKKEHMVDFCLASDVMDHQRSLVILLGGTSGTGKSTLASLLASRLGIRTVLSTDSIRHVLRNFLNQEENPCLFCSTYQAGELYVTEESLSNPIILPSLFETSRPVPQTGSISTNSSKRIHKRKILRGYQLQSIPVLEYLDSIISDFEARGESAVIEGVHLNIELLLPLLERHPSCVPFLIFISNEDKHKERFAIRSKYMTLQPQHNKYVKFFKNIRVIQKKLWKQAQQHLIPCVDNTNVDRSLAAIHSTIVRTLRRTAAGEPVFNPTTATTQSLNEAFEHFYSKTWSSKAMRRVLKQKKPKQTTLATFFQNGVQGFEEKHIDDQREQVLNVSERPCGGVFYSLPIYSTSGTAIENETLRDYLVQYQKHNLEPLFEDKDFEESSLQEQIEECSSKGVNLVYCGKYAKDQQVNVLPDDSSDTVKHTIQYKEESIAQPAQNRVNLPTIRVSEGESSESHIETCTIPTDEDAFGSLVSGTTTGWSGTENSGMNIKSATKSDLASMKKYRDKPEPRKWGRTQKLLENHTIRSPSSQNDTTLHLTLQNHSLLPFQGLLDDSGKSCSEDVPLFVEYKSNLIIDRSEDSNSDHQKFKMNAQLEEKCKYQEQLCPQLSQAINLISLKDSQDAKLQNQEIAISTSDNGHSDLSSFDYEGSQMNCNSPSLSQEMRRALWKTKTEASRNPSKLLMNRSDTEVEGEDSHSGSDMDFHFRAIRNRPFRARKNQELREIEALIDNDNEAQS